MSVAFSVRRLAVLAACGVALLAASAAWGSTIFTYAQGVGGVGGVFHTTGFEERDFNRVYHQSGYTWCVWYTTTDGVNHAITCNADNPTIWPNHIGYAKSVCHNTNDNSGVTWTCQTTRP